MVPAFSIILAGAATAEDAAGPTASAAATTPATEAAPVDRTEEDCKTYIEAILGRGDSKLLDNQDVKAIGKAVPELVVCGAVLADSEEPCTRLEMDFEQCNATQAAFHALRKDPDGGAFMMSDTDFERCKMDKMMQPYCQDLRAAVLARDPDKCPKGAIEKFCRAFVSLDPSLCSEIKAEDFKNVEGMKNPPSAAEVQRHCVSHVQRYSHFAKGLEELAKSDNLDGQLAKAALGQSDACAKYAEQAMKICMELPPPAAATPGTGGEAAPADRSN